MGGFGFFFGKWFSQNRLSYESGIFTGAKQSVYGYVELGYERNIYYFSKKWILSDFF